MNCYSSFKNTLYPYHVTLNLTYDLFTVKQNSISIALLLIIRTNLKENSTLVLFSERIKGIMNSKKNLYNNIQTNFYKIKYDFYRERKI